MDIKNRIGNVIFSASVSTTKELVIEALNNRASLRRADLYEADLSGAILNRADLREANLNRADLRGADLREANLSRAELRDADLYEADLRSAILNRADLREADLRDADLSRANLNRADLYKADLREANLSEANKIPPLAAAQTVLLPEGDLVGWKKCRNGVIVKLLIPQEARRSNSTGRKCRAEYVQVLEVLGAEMGISQHDSTTKYQEGAIVKCDKWNEDRWTECGGGIHFFITEEEARDY